MFMISDFGPGFPFWLPNGMIIRNILENFWYEEHTKENYKFIKTPTMLSKELWKLSGHWANYKDNMYTSEIDGREFAIKPMNCPGGMLVYKNSLHSYRDLPLRVGELGLVHRHEASGALSGLFRVRTFTQDDAHIFMKEEDIESEVINLIKFIDRMYAVFGLSYSIELSTRPLDKFIGEISVWDRAEEALKNAVLNAGKEYKLNPGDGAFYGPKLDFKVYDSLGRQWQCGTIQLDMQLPKRFELFYIDEHGEKREPIMLHRVIYGSIERFIGILIEHYAGAFPLWLSPVQINIIPVNNAYHLDYALDIKNKLLDLGLRVEVDDREEKLGYKMRESQTKKIPITLVLGDNEKESNFVNVRRYGVTETENIVFDEFVKLVLEAVKNKSKNI